MERPVENLDDERKYGGIEARRVNCRALWENKHVRTWHGPGGVARIDPRA